MIKYTLEDAFNALKTIEFSAGSIAKADVLKDQKDNTFLTTLLVACYNPFIQYWIKKIPSAVENCEGEGISLERYAEFLTMLATLNKREVTGNAAIEKVETFLKSCSAEEYKWYTRVLKKDMECGLATAGINKVLKGLIPTYEVMLADKMSPEDLNLDTKKALKMLPDRIVCQYKIDGYRLNIHVTNDGEVFIRTRNGKFVSGYNKLVEDAKKLPKGYVYDGELVSPELFDWIEKNSGSGSVIANRDLFAETMSHAFSHEENKEGILNLFDMVPINEWNLRKPTETYEKRLENIATLVAPLGLKNIYIVPTSKVFSKNNPDDLKAIVELFHNFLNVGWEGLMIKNLDGLYEWKRTKSLIKMKLMDTIDLEVVSLFEGTGKYVGMMGGAVVQFKGNTVGVGSGWSDDQRKLYWDNPNLLIGKTIEISYQAETKNKEGKPSLSFPVIKCVREDK